MNELLIRAAQAILGLTVTYTLYPVVGAGTVAGTTVTSGAGAWGADKEIIAAGGIVAEFWVCALDIDTNGGAQPVVVELEIAAATSIFSARMDLTAATSNIGRFAVPYPKYIPASSQITGRASGTGAKTYNCSVLVATGF